MALQLPPGVELLAPLKPAHQALLGSEALAFIAMLHRQFEPRRRELLALRQQRQAELDAGKLPDFLPETAAIRHGDWQIAPLPAELQDRRVEITGPAERKMMINALNSGASCFMADFEDAMSPCWHNIVHGHQNMCDAWRGSISHHGADGRHYQLNAETATLMLRPRGWHLPEKHLRIDGQPVSAALFDFGLSWFHNAVLLHGQGRGLYYYLPKLENHLEARLWNDIFLAAQQALALPVGSIRATVLIEHLLAAFEMDEILYELREHSAGLNAGRWDYIFSCIKSFRQVRHFCLADREQIGMTVPFMRSYALLLLKTCHRRGAPAIGGMSALTPIKHDVAANERALAAIRADKEREARDGYDGSWVAHPALVPLACEAFRSVMGDAPNQLQRQREHVVVTAADLLNFQPETPITEAGLRNNISVGLQYLGAWLSGNGCVPIHNQMEDAATAEIARAQLWQWLHSPKGVLADGRKVSPSLLRDLATDELNRLQAEYGSRWSRHFEDAAQLFDLLITSEDFIEFFTLPGYEYLD
ncbi:malate synthase A [Vogesella sp. LIG4]|uniref:malate synthase A n=1 Tax=Vogesella sp. LIG4 TaxID=1192162 RepID=UPI00081F9AFF|nr:malate synthase A [Vogesella sp. LIG4]SCK18134.1 malate synthase [Vogesella sp. LIG4]